MKPSDQFAMVFLFGILGAAMLAKPTITKVEKMIGLIHKVGIGCAGCTLGVLGTPNTANKLARVERVLASYRDPR